jgi:hypothetical protein
MSALQVPWPTFDRLAGHAGDGAALEFAIGTGRIAFPRAPSPATSAPHTPDAATRAPPSGPLPAAVAVIAAEPVCASTEGSGEMQPEGGRGELGWDEHKSDGAELPGAESRVAVAGDPPGDQGCD